MDDLKGLFDRVSHIWGVLVGLVAAGFATWRFWATHGGRLNRALLFSDALRHHFGDDAARAFIADIKEREHTHILWESRLTMVERRLDLALYVCTSEGACKWVSVDLAELFGIDREACVGFGWLEGVEANERAVVYDVWMHAVRNKLPYECKYTVHNRRTNEKIVCITSAMPQILKNGEVLCYVGHVSPELSSGSKETLANTHISTPKDPR